MASKNNVFCGSKSNLFDSGNPLFGKKVHIVNYTGWSKKRHKVNDAIILQPYIIESCGLQQNVPKKILYMTKVNI